MDFSESARQVTTEEEQWKKRWDSFKITYTEMQKKAQDLTMLLKELKAKKRLSTDHCHSVWKGVKASVGC